MAKKLGIIREHIRHKWAWWNGYVRAYTGQIDWPLIVLFRKPLYKSTALIAHRQMARGRVLDVGTGPGRLPVLLVESAPNVECIGIDIEPIVLRDARKHALSNKAYERASFVCTDVSELPFASESFDQVVSMFSLHLWRDRKKGISELHRVLKEDGNILILVGRRLIYPGRVSLLDYFNKKSAKYLIDAFQMAGFRETKIHNAENGALRVTSRK